MKLSIEMIVALLGVGFGVVGFGLAIAALFLTRQDRIKEIARHQLNAFKENELNNRIYLKFIEMNSNKMSDEQTRNIKNHVSETKPDNGQTLAPKDERNPTLVSDAQIRQASEEILPGAEIQLETPVVLYAGVYKDRSFKKVSLTPGDYTIYNITTSPSVPSSGVITIDINAYERVGTTPDYLDEACIVSGSGSNVKVTKPGTVIKEGENWIVTELIEVELN